MQDNPTLPGMPTSQRVCGVPGCGAKLYRDNQSGFCVAHRYRKNQTGPRFCSLEDCDRPLHAKATSGPRFCSLEDCDRPLHAKATSGFCSVHAPNHTPAAVKREADRLAEKAARQSQWRECTADGCTKKLRPHNKSGRCSKHHYVPVDPADRGQCAIEGCDRRLSKRNTLGRCEKHMLPRWVAAECAAEGCTKKLNVTNLIGFCGEHTNGYRRTVALQRNYGITEADYDAMVAAQGGVCAVCGQPPRPGGVRAASRLHVDHDHACCPGVKSCGKCVRALLCQNCNNGLGHFSDDPETLRRAADYLERYAVVPVAA